jgi:hypothetical protein
MSMKCKGLKWQCYTRSSGSLFLSSDSPAGQFRNKLTLCSVVRGPVFPEPLSEGDLKVAVDFGVLWVSAEVISEREVPSKFGTAWWANVKVMRRIVGGCTESLALGDAQISPMDIAQAREAPDGRGKHRFGCQKHIDVDDRFCCQIGNGSAANVLNGRRHFTECIGDSFAKGLKEFGPVGVVVQNDNGIRHG